MDEFYKYMETLKKRENLEDVYIEIYFEKNNFDSNITIKQLKPDIAVSDSIKKELKQIYSNIKIKQDRYTNIIRDTYHDTNCDTKIYTNTYKFIKSIKISANLNIIIFEVSQTFLNQEKFPNLNKYDFTKNITHSKYEFKNKDLELEYIINDNIPHIQMKIINNKFYINKNIFNSILDINL